MTDSQIELLRDEIVALLNSLGAKDAATARPLDDLFKTGRLPFGQVNRGLLVLLQQGRISRVERGGEGCYYLSSGPEQ